MTKESKKLTNLRQVRYFVSCILVHFMIVMGHFVIFKWLFGLWEPKVEHAMLVLHIKISVAY